ncbi:3-deoxy-manno-octulosonate cytidylyltransferase [hydrothermal vent metagenome]|uniref:3-deoxy-manno-octulosonate cytidylyltransferase n=1 Tax=hydrothermal vent metagenome TaxID=652676 RepID=A0A3B1DW61_9ZZZZ
MKEHFKTIGVIPARLQSTRLPRKLLLNETGKPLIQYTWEAAKQASLLDEVIVATDSEEIAKAVRQFGGRAELTGDHPSGTDRIAEVVTRCCAEAEIVVNIQGDEPEIEPEYIDSLASALLDFPHREMTTLATPIRDIQTLEDHSCVKLVRAIDGNGLYFSRSPIPHVRDISPASLLKEKSSPWLLHLGLYAYRKKTLLQLTQLPPSPLEELEKLEQLRALEAGIQIQVEIVPHSTVGIDTPEDYAAFVKRQGQ